MIEIYTGVGNGLIKYNPLITIALDREIRRFFKVSEEEIKEYSQEEFNGRRHLVFAWIANNLSST